MKLNTLLSEIIDERAEKLKFASNLYNGNSALGTAHFDIIQRLGERADKKQIEDEVKAFSRIIPKEKMQSLISNLCQHYGCGDVNSKRTVDRTKTGHSGRLGTPDVSGGNYNPGGKPGNPGQRTTNNPV